MIEAILNKEIVVSKAVSRVIGVIVFVILTSLGAFVRIPLPFTPVPITLQTFFVLLSGAFLGSLGALSQIIYVLLGIAGFPIFTGCGSGLIYLFGPTGGYLLGFILAAIFLSRFINYTKDSLFPVFVIFCIADFILLSCGVFWLKIIFGYSLAKLLFLGFIPFIPGDLFKALVASILFLKIKSRLKQIF